MKTMQRRKWFLSLAIPGLCAAGLAQTQKEVPVAEEPRHHFSFENETLRAFRVEVAPRDRTLLHRHDRDYFYISIGAADIVNAVQGRPEVSAHLADGQVGFAKGGFAHVAENRGDTPFRNFTIEFKRPQTKLVNHCARVDAAQPANCPAIAPDATSVTPEFETEEAIVSSLRVQPGARLALNDPVLPRLLMPIGKIQAELLCTGKKPLRFQAGKDLWAECGKGLTLVNSSKSPARVFSIAIRGSHRN